MKKEINKFLYELLINENGKEITDKIIKGYKEEKPVTIRVNTIKSNLENIENELRKEDITFKKVEWYEDALIIENVREDKIRELQIYKDGEIYMQSLSSMIPVLILNPRKRRKYFRYGSSTRRKNNSNVCNI